MTVAERIRCIPANAHQNDVDWKAHSCGCQHLGQIFSLKVLSIESKLLDRQRDKTQAEHMNRTIKEATIKAFHYPDLESLTAMCSRSFAPLILQNT